MKRSVDSLLMTQKRMNEILSGALFELQQQQQQQQHVRKSSSSSSSSSSLSSSSSSSTSTGETNGCDDDDDDDDLTVYTKKLDSILDKVEAAQASLSKTRCSGVFGKFSSDVFTELAGLKYSIIEFKNSLGK